jgi:uncharacterized protein YlxW (UPF0749 family)
MLSFELFSNSEWERERSRMEAARKRAERQAVDLRERIRLQGADRAVLERQVKEAEDQLAEIQREEEQRHAAMEARRQQERARLDRIGMDNVHAYNFGIVGNAGMEVAPVFRPVSRCTSFQLKKSF